MHFFRLHWLLVVASLWWVGGGSFVVVVVGGEYNLPLVSLKILYIHLRGDAVRWCGAHIMAQRDAVRCGGAVRCRCGVGVGVGVVPRRKNPKNYGSARASLPPPLVFGSVFFPGVIAPNGGITPSPQPSRSFPIFVTHKKKYPHENEFEKQRLPIWHEQIV